MKKRANAYLQRQHQKKTRHQACRKAKQCFTAPQSQGEAMVYHGGEVKAVMVLPAQQALLTTPALRWRADEKKSSD